MLCPAQIQERDETIQDKEKRIYDLKKKNQELEKFKFVLDYKIKELKRQMEPRDNQIADMKRKSDVRYSDCAGRWPALLALLTDPEMGAELAQYHKSNAGLALTIDDLRSKLKAAEREVEKEKEHYCKKDRVNEKAVEADMEVEYNRQREYLERTVASLRRKVAKDVGTHRADNVRIMQENVSLIK
ncbi:MAG: hypothetical protein BJ554DRAFT_909 [Olpidium bornovanus]|uniref:Uncharacterized protein n=1 Tax=Olpidium bornovanus TaxID=278681 RepID=A0A8H8DHI7_9FUNG|nr:MAG: hypothetical protein BJ554DRAFT_909 [Olpidium bornovanus]